MRSVVVLLPASMCAEMPIFRYRSIGVLRGIKPSQCFRARRARAAVIYLESEVREGLVRLGHPVHFLALLHCAAAAFRRFHQFPGQAQWHRFLAALLGRFTQPAHCQRHPAHRPDFHRNLVVGTADATALYLDHRLDVRKCLGEHFERVLAALAFDLRERAINDALGDGLLAVEHDHVDELGDIRTLELRVRKNLPLGYFTTAWHCGSSLQSRPRQPLPATCAAPSSRAATYSADICAAETSNFSRLSSPSAAWRRTSSVIACDP